MTAHLLLAVHHHCRNHGADVGPLLCNASPANVAFFRGTGPGFGILLCAGLAWFWQALTGSPPDKKKGKRR